VIYNAIVELDAKLKGKGVVLMATLGQKGKLAHGDTPMMLYIYNAFVVAEHQASHKMNGTSYSTMCL